MDDFLEFSGENPSQDTTIPLLSEDEALTNDVLNLTSTTTIETILKTTLSPTNDSSSHYYSFERIILLSIKCILSLLVLVLTLAIRKRDFIKVFVFFILFPILLECGFDIFTEIKQSTTNYGHGRQIDGYYTGNYYNMTLNELPHEGIPMYEKVLAYYTRENIYKNIDYFPLVSFILSYFIFWTSLFSSLVVFFFAHKAIIKPEEITYIKYFWYYVKIQVFPILLTVLDTLISLFELPAAVYVPATVLIRVVACLVAFTLLTQMFMSLFVFCASRDEYTKSSPYEQVRSSKWRLFWLISFQIAIQVLNVPYIAWSGISLYEDFTSVFNIPVEVPSHLATVFFVLHENLFMLRPYVFVLCTLLLLSPYRRKLRKTFCPCCNRD